MMQLFKWMLKVLKAYIWDAYHKLEIASASVWARRLHAPTLVLVNEMIEIKWKAIFTAAYNENDQNDLHHQQPRVVRRFTVIAGIDLMIHIYQHVDNFGKPHGIRDQSVQIETDRWISAHPPHAHKYHI